jgi:predicted transcriptional regulator
MNLAAYLSKEGITQQGFADSVGCTQSRVSQLLDGELPSLKLAQRISDVTTGQVGLADWPSERLEAA